MRKLIRPTLEGARPAKSARGPRRPLPPEVTNAEASYLQQAVDDRSLLVITLLDGRQLRGRLEYYDRDCLKLEPEGAARILLRKDKIKHYRVARGEAGSEVAAEAVSPREGGA